MTKQQIKALYEINEAMHNNHGLISSMGLTVTPRQLPTGTVWDLVYNNNIQVTLTEDADIPSYDKHALRQAYEVMILTRIAIKHKLRSQWVL